MKLPLQVCTTDFFCLFFFFFSSRRRHTRLVSDWSSDVCSSDLLGSMFSAKAAPAAKPIRMASSRKRGDPLCLMSLTPHLLDGLCSRLIRLGAQPNASGRLLARFPRRSGDKISRIGVLE